MVITTFTASVAYLTVAILSRTAMTAVELTRTGPDVDTITCAEEVGIPDPHICPGEEVVFTCVTNTALVVWQTSITTGAFGFGAGSALNVPIMFDDDGNFSLRLIVDDGMNLTSTLTAMASDSVQNVQVTCSDTVVGGQMSSDVIQIVEDNPSPPHMITHTVDEVDCESKTAKVAIQWQCPMDVGNTSITHFDVSVPGRGPVRVPGDADSVTIENLDLNTQYDITVTATTCDGAFTSNPSDAVSVNVEVAVPTASNDLNLDIDCETNSILVRWQNPAENDALQCLVQRVWVNYTTDDGGTTSVPLSPSTTSYAINVTEEGATYTVTVAYKNGVGESKNNPSDSFTSSSSSSSSSSGLSTEEVAITAILSSLGSFIVGAVLAAVITHCYDTRRQKASSHYELTSPQPAAAPVYAEVSPQNERVELKMKENIAYGPVRH